MYGPGPIIKTIAWDLEPEIELIHYQLYVRVIERAPTYSEVIVLHLWGRGKRNRNIYCNESEIT